MKPDTHARGATPQRYRDSWEDYWTQTRDDSGPPLWDCDPAEACASNLATLRQFLNPDLPILDLGCGNGNGNGNGTQTRYLADHAARVLGADVSPAAIAMAASAATHPNIDYLVLDVFDTAAVRDLHNRVGDLNVYLCTVLHQILPEHRVGFADALRVLLGGAGVLFLVELAQAAEAYFHVLTEQFGSLPGLVKVLGSGIQHGSVTNDEVLSLLGPEDYQILHCGDNVTHTTHTLPTGQHAQVPAFDLVVGHTLTGAGDDR